MPATPDLAWKRVGAYNDLARGHECFHQQDYTNAIKHYQAALVRQFSDIAYYCLALSYYFIGDYNSAGVTANAYQGSVIELPLYSRGWSNLALDTTPINDLNYLIEKRLELLALKIAS